MTVFFPDLSNWESTVGIQPGTTAVVAKATEGTYYRDASFFRFKDECGRLGIPFSGYHFLIQGEDPVAQANNYHVFAGDVPCMLDVETTGKSKPGVDDVVAFISALKAAGGRCWGVYFPRWYWQQVGGDLSRLEAAGAVLVSSNYTTYDDHGPGWDAYGGAAPQVWQYTNSQPYGGSPCDFNAFRGSASELAALISGGSSMDLNTPVTFSPALVQQYPELAALGFTGSASLGTVLGWMAGRVAHLCAEVEAAKAAAGSDASAVADAILAALKAKL